MVELHIVEAVRGFVSDVLRDDLCFLDGFSRYPI
jgi:hypothetical protein